MNKLITIINFGMGNLRSLQNALDHLGANSRIVSEPESIATSDKLILPGVGSFTNAMINIEKSGFRHAMERAVIERSVPLLGICLGMQLLANIGEEGGNTKGLGWVPGKIVHLNQHEEIRIPHIGFNTVNFQGMHGSFFNNLGLGCDFYFVHSFHFIPYFSEHIIGTFDYGEKLVCAVRKDNIFGVQFHPEKSQSNGLQLLRNFINYF